MTKSDEASIVRSLRRIAKALESMQIDEERETTNGNEDAISREKAISMITGTASRVCELDVIDSPKGLLMTGAAFRQNEIIDILQNMPSAQLDSSFITWLLDEIWDEDMWELNWQAFPEIVCR